MSLNFDERLRVSMIVESECDWLIFVLVAYVDAREGS